MVFNFTQMTAREKVLVAFIVARIQVRDFDRQRPRFIHPKPPRQCLGLHFGLLGF